MQRLVQIGSHYCNGFCPKLTCLLHLFKVYSNDLTCGSPILTEPHTWSVECLPWYGPSLLAQYIHG